MLLSKTRLLEAFVRLFGFHKTGSRNQSCGSHEHSPENENSQHIHSHHHESKKAAIQQVNKLYDLQSIASAQLSTTAQLESQSDEMPPTNLIRLRTCTSPRFRFPPPWMVTAETALAQSNPRPCSNGMILAYQKMGTRVNLYSYEYCLMSSANGWNRKLLQIHVEQAILHRSDRVSNL